MHQDSPHKAFGLTRRVRTNKLLQMGDPGDRMPSVLMDEMLALLDGHQPCMLFEQLFLNRMPEVIRLQLADGDFAAPRKVAEQADELWQSMSHSSYSTVHKVLWPRRQVQVKPTGSVKEIDNNNADWCFYHNKFGDKARKCLKSRTVAGNTLAGRQ